MSPRPDAVASGTLPVGWWARGRAPHERTGDHRVPEWATSIAEAIGTARAPRLKNGTEPYRLLGQALAPLVEAATAAVLRTQMSVPVTLSAVADGFAAQLTWQLGRLAARTLVTELHIARDAGLLDAGTGRLRFRQHVERTAGDLGRLVSTYPVLGRMLGNSCRHSVAAQVELLERFAADRAEIVEELLGGVDPGPLVATQGHAGDTHCRGRSVSMLRFGSGATVVYKPRCQRMQQFYGELVGWLNGKVSGLDLRAPATLCRAGYGWVEFVEHLPCGDIGQVDGFYRRQGALLALLHAVNGTDIHFENLIAHVDQPVLVDVETLFHPTLSVPSAVGPDPAMRAFENSVCRSALLPQLLIGEHGALDLSGLGGDPGATFPTTSVDWVAPGTDQMRLVRRPRDFAGAQNRPLLAGKPAEPTDYQAPLLLGFRSAYDAVVADRAELAGLLARCADFDVRVVLRPSALYATLLDESTHPDVLRDGLDRQQVFDVLRADGPADSVTRRTFQHEITDLWAGDIPFFTTRPGSRDVYATSGERVPDLLATTGLRAALDKIAAMGELDRRFQEWLITASLAVRAPATDHRSGGHLAVAVAPTRPTPERFLAHACSIGDDLVATAVHDGRRANWLGVELVDGRHWMIQPLGAGLADGYLGVALFLAELGHLTASERYSALARKAITPVPALLAAMAHEPRLGSAVGPGLLGLGGIAYALCRIGGLLGDDDVLGLVPSVVDLLDGMAGYDVPGFAAGRAGALAALCGVATETGLPAAASAAGSYANLLLADAGPDAWSARPPGFAHGAAGVAYALLRFGEFSGEARYADAGRALLPADRDDDVGWCCGAAGVLVAHSALPEAGHRPPDELVAGLEDRPSLCDTSLCHGELGVLEALCLVAGTGHAAARAVLKSNSARLLAVVNSHGARCATPDGVPSPGLLTGLAGIGYGLLRLGFPARIPSVLTLSPGKCQPPVGVAPNGGNA